MWGGAGRGNPRIVNARSSHGISLEHEWASAWQYVSISRAMWQRKRYGYLYVLSCLQGAHKCAEYQWLSVVEQAGMRRFNVKRSTFNVWWCTSVFLAIYYNKISLHSIGGVYSVYSLQSENERLLLDVIIYIINLFSQSQRSVNNGL